MVCDIMKNMTTDQVTDAVSDASMKARNNLKKAEELMELSALIDPSVEECNHLTDDIYQINTYKLEVINMFTQAADIHVKIAQTYISLSDS